jgi:hypothetical protein
MTASESKPLALLTERSARLLGFRSSTPTSGHAPILEWSASEVLFLCYNVALAGSVSEMKCSMPFGKMSLAKERKKYEASGLIG